MRKEFFFALTAWRRLGHFAKILRLRRACSAARRPATLAQFRAPHRQAVVLDAAGFCAECRWDVKRLAKLI